MALGGGNFVTQNKILPGSYINFVSAARASATLSDRGIVAMPLELDWGLDDKVFEVNKGDFEKNALKIFGYDYAHEKLKGLRDLFKNSRKLYAYKLNSAGEKASNAFASAKHSGVRGNALKIVIQENVDDSSKFDVRTLIDTTLVEIQTVADASDLVSNDFVDFKADTTLAVTASTPLEGGSNGSAITGTEWQNFLNKIEPYAFNALGAVTSDEEVKGLIAAFTSRLRDEMGVKFQAVLHDMPADDKGVINVKNRSLEGDEASLVYWVTGATAGCEVNRSNLNKVYDGEFEADVDYTQAELENAIQSGEFTLHQVGDGIRVLNDINSLVTVSDSEGEIFKENQTVRVIDQIANDIAVIFNTKYLGTVPNDEAGRISLWSDIVKHHEQLQDIRAIEEFEDGHVVVEQGDTKKSVVVEDAITVVNAMGQLYMTTVVA